MKTKKIIAISLVLAAIGLLVVTVVYSQMRSSPSHEPSFQAVLPSDKSIEELDGWRRVSPPNNDPVHAYSDEIDGVSILVSQQPLPKSSQADSNTQVSDMAREFNATNEIDTGSTTAYLGTSSKGPQYAILSKGNLLILIKAEKQIPSIAWIDYINSLK